jgi:sugar phosphate isomerase/epimerase
MSAPFTHFENGDKTLARLAPHTITTKPWDLPTALAKYAAQGIGGISIWRDAIGDMPLNDAAKLIADSGVTPVSYVRGGFYTGATPAVRQTSIDDNLKMIDEAAALGIPMIVLVCGATPGISINENICQIRAGIEATVAHAEASGVRLAIEPLHPMYADQRSAVATMKAANNLCDRINSPMVGVAVDVYHVWWDPELEAELARCGRDGRIFALHLCDWKLDMEHMLQDRGLMGEGIIDIPRIRQLAEDVGFRGYLEVEIFSQRWWAEDQDQFLAEIIRTYQENS